MQFNDGLIGLRNANIKKEILENEKFKKYSRNY